jgi:hypothetical protein
MALKTLSSTGISNGNPILPGQVTQSVDAFTGTEGYAITVSGSFTFTGATTGSGVFSNAVSSSFATTASFAVNYTNPTLIEGTSYPSGSVQVPNSPLKFIAGASKTDGSSLSVVNISETSGKIYGQSLFIVATTLEPAAAGYISVQFPVAPPNITFVTSAPNTDFTYQIIYI